MLIKFYSLVESVNI